jgi:XTP/dITP diphosphohydrolase
MQRLMSNLMLATGNPGKVIELRDLLARHLDLSTVSLLTPRDWPAPLPQVAETGTTFAENARLKADALASATGLPSLADDSGLCVDALGGAPGLLSARWAGAGATDADRNAKLLLALAEVPPERRTARFVCAAALAVPGGRTVTEEGICKGVILDAPRGANGFGYDPLFFLPNLERTMAELTSDEKNRLSHRALAVSRLSSHFWMLLNPG